MEETNEAIVQKKRGRLPLILGIGLAVLLAIYLALCTWATYNKTIWPNSVTLGMDLGGLTTQEAVQLQQAFLPNMAVRLFLYDQALPDPVRGETPQAQLSLEELGVTVHAEDLAQAAYERSHSRGFFLSGWYYFSQFFHSAEIGLDGCVDVDTAVMEQALRALTDQLERPAVDAAYALEREGLSVTTARDGLALDRTALRQMLAEYRWSTDLTLDVPYAVLPANALTAQALHDEISGELQNARYDPETKSILPERVGAEFDVSAAQALLDAAAPGETVLLPAELQFPKVTAKELEQVLFRDVLGTYTTHVGGSAGRIGNVRLSAGKVNEFVLNAGEIFSYNDVVGERTAANGYQPAPAYVKGETVDEIGGGICQTSSTVYMAALLSNLEIVERYAHRYVPAYIPWGMDATVSWGGPEFRFRNNTDYPVKLVAGVSKKNYLTITVYGTKTDDVTVKMTNQVLSTTPYETVRQEDATLAPGTQTVKVTPYTGYKVEAYRNLYDGNGKLLSSTLESVSNYKVRNQLILVGPALVTPEVPETVPPDLPAGGDAALPVTPPVTPPEEPTLPEEPTEPPAA